MRLFDTHLHLDAFADPLPIWREAREAGVDGALLPGVSPGGWQALLRLCTPGSGLRAAPGVHPQNAGEWSDETCRHLEGLLADRRVVAIGEIGLDGLLAAPSREEQESAFRDQLRLALAAGLPVLIHCRRADGRLLEMLRQERAQRVGGILHAFSGSPETAREAIRLNFAIGFGGPLTYPNARRAPEVLRQVPADAIVLETDAPDLTPHPLRGTENRPALLPLIASRVAELRGWSEEETARITTANARRVLKISDER